MAVPREVSFPMSQLRVRAFSTKAVRVTLRRTSEIVERLVATAMFSPKATL